MSEIQIKNGGSWVKPKEYWVKQSGVWTKAKEIHCKSGGSWVKVYGSAGIPENMIILYPDASYVTNAKYGTLQTSLYGLFPTGKNSAPLSLGGSDTHDGSAHGASGTLTTNTLYGHKITKGSLVISGIHHHTVPSHSHAGVTSHIPQYVELSPVLGANVIKSGAVFLSINTINNSMFLLESLYANYFLRFGNASAKTGGALSHAHTSVSLTTSAAISDGNTNSSVTGTTATVAYNDHTHSATHTAVSSNNNPPSTSLLLYSYNNDEQSSLDFLPSGVVGFFTTNNIPQGWSVYTNIEGRLVKIVTESPGQQSGNDTHNHIGQITTGSAPAPAVKAGTYTGRQNPDPHTFTDSHTTAVSLLPAWVGLYIGVKQ